MILVVYNFKHINTNHERNLKQFHGIQMASLKIVLEIFSFRQTNLTTVNWSTHLRFYKKVAIFFTNLKFFMVILSFLCVIKQNPKKIKTFLFDYKELY